MEQERSTYTILLSPHGKGVKVAVTLNGNPIDFDWIPLESPDSRLMPQEGSIYIGRVMRCKKEGIFVDIGESLPGFIPHKQAGSLSEGGYGAFLVTRPILEDRGGTKGPRLKRIDLDQEGSLEDFAYENVKGDEVCAALKAALSAASRKPALFLAAPSELIQILKRYPPLKIITGNFEIAAYTRSLEGFRPYKDLLEIAPNAHLFDAFGVAETWHNLFDSSVALPSGGNVVIERTAACIAIDVNSAESFLPPLKTNLEAAEVLFEHLFWRKLYGQIIIDFLPILPRERGVIADVLRKGFKEMGGDFYGISKIGFFEAIRKVQGRALEDKIS